MKELLRSKIGKKVFKAMIWGVVGFAIAAAGNGLLILVMETFSPKNAEGVFAFLYGMFYCIMLASYYVFLASVITLLVMIIAKYSKRCFRRRMN